MSFVYACYICLVSLRLASSWSLQRCCLLLQIKQLSVVPVRPVSPVSPVCRLSYCKDNANWHNYKIKICQRSHYFSSLPFKMTFFSQFALLHHVLRNIIYDFFINRNTIKHSCPIVRNIDMSVISYSQSPD